MGLLSGWLLASAQVKGMVRLRTGWEMLQTGWVMVRLRTGSVKLQMG